MSRLERCRAFGEATMLTASSPNPRDVAVRKITLQNSTPGSNLLPSAAAGATLLRFVLATWWIAHWWYKVGVVGMPGTESFFIHEGLPAWLAWFDISFELVVTACLILGVYVPLVCLISLPILVASMIIFSSGGFYFYTSGGIELPILWALVQIVQALLGPGVFRITPPKWLPRVPVLPALGP